MIVERSESSYSYSSKYSVIRLTNSVDESDMRVT